jgi:hypothetical protein
LQAASNVASSKSKDAKTKKDNIKYAAWAAQQIAKQYKVKPDYNTNYEMIGDIKLV